MRYIKEFVDSGWSVRFFREERERLRRREREEEGVGRYTS